MQESLMFGSKTISSQLSPRIWVFRIEMGKGDRGTALQEPLLGSGYPTNHNDQFARTLTRSLEDIQKSLERQSNEDGLRFGMTPVRRMFCLLSLFDFLLAFLLWIIYAQVSKLGRLSILTSFLVGIVNYLCNTSKTFCKAQQEDKMSYHTEWSQCSIGRLQTVSYHCHVIFKFFNHQWLSALIWILKNSRDYDENSRESLCQNLYCCGYLL